MIKYESTCSRIGAIFKRSMSKDIPAKLENEHDDNLQELTKFLNKMGVPAVYNYSLKRTFNYIK